MIEVYFDGAFAISTGTMGLGCVVKKDGVEVYSHHSRIEVGGVVNLGSDRMICKETSNNVSEYLSCIRALEFVFEFYPNEKIKVYGDSQLVINQMAGKWSIKKGVYTPYAKYLWNLKWKLKSPEFIWIPRNQNTECDSLSRKSL